MRIRSIHPEFWRSEDVGRLDWTSRLLFIGLWSYVDDNGVGRDVERLIVADLFPLEDDPRATLATVSRGLQQLAAGGQITRYEVDGKPFLYISAWAKWQRIDRPGKPRYPLPTCDDATPRDTLATPSRDSHDSLDAGEGEKGRRGEGEKAADAAADRFPEFYDLYPRKDGRGQAVKAWKAATKKASPDDIIAGLNDRLHLWKHTDRQFIPMPATWLNGERWADEIPQESDEASDEPRYLTPAEIQARRGF